MTWTLLYISATWTVNATVGGSAIYSLNRGGDVLGRVTSGNALLPTSKFDRDDAEVRFLPVPLRPSCVTGMGNQAKSLYSMLGPRFRNRNTLDRLVIHLTGLMMPMNPRGGDLLPKKYVGALRGL